MEDNTIDLIINAAIGEFNVKGIKFTMDDVANKIHISKKTIYKHFKDKQELLLACIDKCFDLIKDAEQSVYDNDELDVVEKLKRILIVLPDVFSEIDWVKVSETVNNNPELYARFKYRLDTGWEKTNALIDEGIAAGKIKNISKTTFKIMVESSIEGFIVNSGGDNKVEYLSALNEMIDIFMNGIIKR